MTKILLALSIRVSILFAYRILSYVTVSKIFTKGIIDEKINKHLNIASIFVNN